MARRESIYPIPFNDARMSHYERIMDEAPAKFTGKAAAYRKAKEGENRCDQCVHFFQRVLDSYHVCEIVRPVPEEEILPEWTCKFTTADGKTFPLYK